VLESRTAGRDTLQERLWEATTSVVATVPTAGDDSAEASDAAVMSPTLTSALFML
jgi:hypothetical protein